MSEETESRDIRSLLESRARSKVPPRQLSLGKSELAASSAGEDDSSEEQPDAKTSTPKSTKAKREQNLSGLQSELDSLPQVGKRLAIHLEQNIRAELVKLCDRSDITPEIFLEAAFALMQSRPELIKEAIADAKVRLAQRKRAGLVRRTLAMVQKLDSAQG